MNGPIKTRTPVQLVNSIRETLSSKVSGNEPGYTLILGSGVSYGIVPTTQQMMREAMGPYMAGRERIQPPAGATPLEATRLFWAEFNRQNQADATGVSVRLGADGLPADITAAYQALASGDASLGLSDPASARDFIRVMTKQARHQLNGAYFFLAALLRAQQAGQLKSSRPFCRTIFTTNFDPLLQTSLQLVDQLYYMTDLPELKITPHHLREDEDAIHLIYAHGSIHRPNLANSELDLARLEENASAFSGYLGRRGVIVIGYSGWNDSLMKALSDCPSFEHNLYWCDIKPPTELTPLAQDLLRSGAGPRYYVQLTKELGYADGLMGMLYQELVREGGVPPLLWQPLSVLIEQLENINLSGIEVRNFVVDSEQPPVAATPGPSPSGAPRDATTAPPPQNEPGNPVVQRPAPLRIKAEDLRHGAIEQLKAARALADQRVAATKSGVSILGATSKAPSDEQEPAAALAARQLLGDALNAFFAGQMKKAIQLWTGVLDLADAEPSQRIEAALRRGMAQMQQARLREATEDFTRALETPEATCEDKAKAFIQRGSVAGTLGRYAEAVRDFTAALGLPGAPAEAVMWARLNRAMTYGMLGKLPEALGDHEILLKMEDLPPEFVGRVLATRAQTLLFHQRWRDAIVDLDRLIQLPDAPRAGVIWALEQRGQAWVQLKERGRALDDFTTLAQQTDLSPRQLAGAHNFRGWVQYREGRGDPAAFLADMQRVLEVDPEFPGGRLNLGVALLFAGRDAEAQEAFVRAVAENPFPMAVQGAGNILGQALQVWLSHPRAAPLFKILQAASQAPGMPASAGSTTPMGPAGPSTESLFSRIARAVSGRKP